MLYPWGVLVSLQSPTKAVRVESPNLVPAKVDMVTLRIVTSGVGNDGQHGTSHTAPVWTSLGMFSDLQDPALHCAEARVVGLRFGSTFNPDVESPAVVCDDPRHDWVLCQIIDRATCEHIGLVTNTCAFIARTNPHQQCC